MLGTHLARGPDESLLGCAGFPITLVPQESPGLSGRACSELLYPTLQAYGFRGSRSADDPQIHLHSRSWSSWNSRRRASLSCQLASQLASQAYTSIWLLPQPPPSFRGVLPDFAPLPTCHQVPSALRSQYPRIRSSSSLGTSVDLAPACPAVTAFTCPR